MVQNFKKSPKGVWIPISLLSTDEKRVLLLEKAANFRGHVLQVGSVMEGILHSIVIAMRHNGDAKKYYSINRQFSAAIDQVVSMLRTKQDLKGLMEEPYITYLAKDLEEFRDRRNILAHHVVALERGDVNTFDGQLIGFMHNDGKDEIINFFNDERIKETVKIANDCLTLLPIIHQASLVWLEHKQAQS